MTEPQQPDLRIGETRAYWTHKVDSFPGPVAQFRMAQLIDLDDRLYETARIVYRFMLGWYHDGHGDALISQRHVAKVMKQRAPEGAVVPSRNAVQRAILALMEAGWVVRSFQGRGRGRGASRYVPVANVLDLAAQGKFPELAHANGPVEAELAHANGPKTHIHDPRTDAGTCIVEPVSAALGGGAEGATPADGFDEIWKAYKRHGNKQASRAAWEAIGWAQYDYGPEHVIARARSWAASAKPGQRRMPLEKWIEAEKFDQADRAVESKAKAVTGGIIQSEPPTPANDNLPAPRLVTIVDSTIAKDGFGDSYIQLFLADTDLPESTERIVITYEHTDRLEQDAGQRDLSDLCSALELDGVDDTEELHGKPFLYGRTIFGAHKFYPASTAAAQEA